MSRPLLSPTALARARARTEATMPHTASVLAPSATWGPGGVNTPGAESVLAQYPCRLAPAGTPAEGIVADRVAETKRFRIALPFTAAVDATHRLSVEHDLPGLASPIVLQVTGVEVRTTEQQRTVAAEVVDAVTASLAVPYRIVVTPASATPGVGEDVAFTAVVEEQDGTPIPGLAVTWASLDESDAVIDAETGVATALTTSPVTIIATLGALAGSAILNPGAGTPATVTSVVFAPDPVDVEIGTPEVTTLRAWDGATELIGEPCSVMSGDPLVLTVAPASGVTPLVVTVTPVAAGTAQIIGACGGVLGVSDATVTEPPVSGVTDSFDRANNAASMGVADSGQAWSALVGTWGINTNKAYCSAVAAGTQLAAIDAGLADGTVEVTPTTSGAGFAWLAFRIVDSQNYFLWGGVTGAPLTLYRCTAGSFTALGTGSSAGAGGVWGVTLAGNAITCLINGLVALATVNDSQGAAETTHGLAVTNNGDATAHRFDNFAVAP